MAVKELDDGAVDGVRLGQSATTSYVAFYGATPVVKPAATAQSAVVTTAITPLVTTTATTNDISTIVDALIVRNAAVITLVNQLRSDLVTLGLVKGSA